SKPVRPLSKKKRGRIPRSYIIYIGGWPRDVKHRIGISLGRALSRLRLARYNRGFSGGETFPMELKTQALDRLLETLSPVLSQEFDRIIQETTERLDQEFQQRLQHAVTEAETAAQAKAASDHEQALVEARDAGRRQAAEELEQQFRQRLSEATESIRAEAASERQQIQAQLDQWRAFAVTQSQLGEASSQPEILSRFLSLAESFTGGLAVYVAKADGLALWKSRGNAAFPDIISK